MNIYDLFFVEILTKNQKHILNFTYLNIFGLKEERVASVKEKMSGDQNLLSSNFPKLHFNEIKCF